MPDRFCRELSHIKVLSARPQWTQLLLPATTEARNIVVGYVRCEISDLENELGEQLVLAADELLRNAIEHGGDAHCNPNCMVQFSYLRTPRMIQFQIKDTGPGFSMAGAGTPLSTIHPKILSATRNTERKTACVLAALESCW